MLCNCNVKWKHTLKFLHKCYFPACFRCTFHSWLFNIPSFTLNTKTNGKIVICVVFLTNCTSNIMDSGWILHSYANKSAQTPEVLKLIYKAPGPSPGTSPFDPTRVHLGALNLHSRCRICMPLFGVYTLGITSAATTRAGVITHIRWAGKGAPGCTLYRGSFMFHSRLQLHWPASDITTIETALHRKKFPHPCSNLTVHKTLLDMFSTT